MKGLNINNIELPNLTMNRRSMLWELIDYVLYSIARNTILFEYDDIKRSLVLIDSSLSTDEIYFICIHVDSILK